VPDHRDPVRTGGYRTTSAKSCRILIRRARSRRSSSWRLRPPHFDLDAVTAVCGSWYFRHPLPTVSHSGRGRVRPVNDWDLLAGRAEERWQSSSKGSRRSAICVPTIEKNSALWPTGSGISKGSRTATCDRSPARSATFCVLPSDASRAASLNVKVLWSWCGANSRTASRCALVMVTTRSASEAILDVSCRAAKWEAVPPSFSRTSAASGWIG
jgi:hypothetical protein